MKNKPLALSIEDSKNELVSFINDICNKYNISYYFLNIILNDIHTEVIERKNNELALLKDNYSSHINQKEGDSN